MLSINSFLPHLKLYGLIASTLRNESLTTPPNELSQLHLNLLIESTFLQMYATLEEALILECNNALVPKKASISRFEKALAERGYLTDSKPWLLLIEVSKIRNCILHGNGLVTADQYGELTKAAILGLNTHAQTSLIEVKTQLFTSFSKVTLNESFLTFYFDLIRNFINAQKVL